MLLAVTFRKFARQTTRHSLSGQPLRLQETDTLSAGGAFFCECVCYLRSSLEFALRERERVEMLTRENKETGCSSIRGFSFTEMQL
jgi:hypothetical protein